MNQSGYSILDSIGVAVYVMDRECCLVYANSALESTTGLTVNTILGQKCCQVFGVNENEICFTTCPINRILAGESSEPCRFEKILRILDGEISVQIYASPLFSQGKITGCTAVIQDITRLRRLELQSRQLEQQLSREFELRKYLTEDLRRSEALYRATFEHTGTAMLVIEENRIISMANREVENLTGYSRKEIVGKRTWDEFVHPDDLENMMKYHLKRRKTGKNAPGSYEYRMFHSSGKLLDIFFTIGMIPGTGQSVGSMMDITSRKEMERALRESEEKHRLLLDNIEDIFYEVDLMGNYTFLNDSVLRVTGFSKNYLIGRSYRDNVDEEDALKAFAAFNKVYTSGVPERGFNWAIRRPDGEKRDIEVSISPIKNSQGAIIGFRGTSRDITERKAAEERLKYLSLHDAMTGLYNRTYFEEELQRLEKGRQYPVSFICADVDGLKKVNDTMGHKKGDELLIAAAQTLKKSMRCSDVVARVGGDEFVVILPGAEEKAAETACRRIRDSLEQHNRDNPELPLNISLGWATTSNKQSMMELYKKADDNMYKEKSQKKKAISRHQKSQPY